MIRILHVLGGLNRGGAETMVMNLYRAIDKTKIQFDFVIHTNEHQAYYDEIVSLGGKIYSFPKMSLKNIFAIKRRWKTFLDDHREYRIMHSHIRSYASLFLPIAKRHGIKTIVHSHSTSNGKGVSSVIKRLLQYPIRFQSDFFFACSVDSGKWLFGKKVIKSNRFFVLQNAIYTNNYIFKEKERVQCRDELRLKDEKVFIHIGRFHESKNHKFLLELFNEIHSKDITSKLLLVGDGSLKTMIENQIKEFGLNESVILTGSRNDVPRLLMAADCFLFPSKWEGLPVTVVEAQAAGLPCVISNRITNEVCLTKSVINVTIDNGIKPWLDIIFNMSFERYNNIKAISESGFDIKRTTSWLTEFYERITE